jgi:isopropylmalate/homocitrate/citramalate synthase
MNLEKFRNLMAENGFEFTPEQADEIYKGAKNIIKKAKKMSQVDFWELKNQKFEGITEEEKNEIIEIYKRAKEIWVKN